MKLKVDRELCEANAICMQQCAEVFRVEDDDTLTLLMEEVPQEHLAAVQEAVRLCPRQALELV